MGLSFDLISQFAKLTKNKENTKKETVSYGTIVEMGENKFVRIDGSDILTPMISTINVNHNERVTVMVKNHTAVVTGNITNPAARTNDVAEAGSDAEKVATNYMYLDKENGLMIGDKSTGAWNGFRTQVTSTAFNILNSAGEVLSSYGAKIIELGKNATDAVIKFCGGKVKLSTYTSEDGSAIFALQADRIGLEAEDDTYSSTGLGNKLVNGSYDVTSRLTSYSTKKSSTDYSALMQLSTAVTSQEGAMGSSMHNNASVTMKSDLNSGTIQLSSYGLIDIYTMGNYVRFNNAPILCDNGKYMRFKDASGKSCIVIGLNSNNNINIGEPTISQAANGHQGDTVINALAGAIRFRNKTGALKFQLSSNTDTYDGYFHPETDGRITLGRSNYKWIKIYATSDVISTSDERLKHDIVAISDLPVPFRSDGENVLEKLFSKLIPKVFYLNSDSDEKLQIGFVAQDISASLEELGMSEDELGLINHEYWTDEETEEEKDEYGLIYSQVIALNTHMIQKLRKENEDLKARLAKIESLLNITS